MVDPMWMTMLECVIHPLVSILNPNSLLFERLGVPEFRLGLRHLDFGPCKPKVWLL